MINAMQMWADSYEKKFKEVYGNVKGAQTFNAVQADLTAAKSWQEWNDENAKSIQCVSPTAAPITLTGKTNATAMAPLPFSTAKSGPQVAQMLATAWQTWANSISWTMVPPSPPYSAITAVLIDPSSISSSYATLYSGLIAEMANVPKDDAGVKIKYQTLGQLFFTAAAGLRVQFIGLSMSSPPVALIIPVPVF